MSIYIYAALVALRWFNQMETRASAAATTLAYQIAEAIRAVQTNWLHIMHYPNYQPLCGQTSHNVERT